MGRAATYAGPVAAFWASFRLDPRIPANADLRSSDVDREVVRELLAEAYADGRLSREEYDDRLATLLESRTLGELPPLVSDLVSPADGGPPAVAPRDELRARAASAYRRDVQEALSAFLVPSLVCLVIWLAAGHGFFWPGFVMLGTGINLVRTAVQRESIIEQEARRLEKRERKARDLRPPRADEDS